MQSLDLNIISSNGSVVADDLLSGAMVLINKPTDWTSFDVVNKIRSTIRYSFNIKKIKVGHAGTLDPLATGLLIICIGSYTKKIEQFQNLNKGYAGAMRLGVISDSYDLETELRDHKSIDGIDVSQIKENASRYKGLIDQTPPMYSAIKKNGVALYKLARKGKSVEIKSRKVNVESLDILEYCAPDASFDVVCSKGTYIRSLVHDIGQSLGCGAVMTRLKRTAIGNYNLKDAWELDQFINILKNQQ